MTRSGGGELDVKVGGRKMAGWQKYETDELCVSKVVAVCF
jgi:hypothetical protein